MGSVWAPQDQTAGKKWGDTSCQLTSPIAIHQNGDEQLGVEMAEYNC